MTQGLMTPSAVTQLVSRPQADVSASPGGLDSSARYPAGGMQKVCFIGYPFRIFQLQKSPKEPQRTAHSPFIQLL